MFQNKTMRKLLFIFTILIFSSMLLAGASVELVFSGGMWSLNLVKGQIESLANDQIDNAIRDTIENDYPELRDASYMHTVNFDSSGGNYGVGLRIYPGGEKGSFSLGVFLLKTNMNLEMDGTIRIEKEGNYGVLDGKGKVNINTPALLLELRWEIFPSSLFSPYITFGGGVGYLNGNAEFNGEMESHIEGQVEYDTISENKTFDQLREETKGVPKVMPFAKLVMGLRARLTTNLNAFVEGGILDGFVLSGGVTFKF